MSNETSAKGSPNAGWFSKGRSGNPKGRPRGSGKRTARGSAFEILLDRTLTVTAGNLTREISMEEALQERTFKDALAGKRMAIKEVLKWIAAYEEWLGRHTAKPPVQLEPFVSRSDPKNADEALLLLGIATRFVPHPEEVNRSRLLLEPWAAQLALNRLRHRFDRQELDHVRHCTRDADSLVWR